MLYPVKAIISKVTRKDGTNAINFQYCFSPTNRTVLKTGIVIPLQYWNAKRQLVSKNLPATFGDFEKLNDDISRMRKVIETLIDKCELLLPHEKGAFVKEHFNPLFKIEDLKEFDDRPVVIEPSFFEHLDNYIKSKESTVSSVASIKCMKERLVAYQGYINKPITFKDLDYNFYLDFVNYLTYHYKQKRKKDELIGLKVSTL